jgi:hypothetical protein
MADPIFPKTTGNDRLVSHRNILGIIISVCRISGEPMPGASAVTSIAGRRFVRTARMDEVLLPAAPLAGWLASISIFQI